MSSRVDVLRFDSLSSFSGLLAIDLFCDHYSLISSPTTVQVNTCTAYYRNALEQPWYMSLVTLVPILIGTVVMLQNMTRSIYDMLSIPLFAGVLFAFVFRVKKYAGTVGRGGGSQSCQPRRVSVSDSIQPRSHDHPAGSHHGLTDSGTETRTTIGEEKPLRSRTLDESRTS